MAEFRRLRTESRVVIWRLVIYNSQFSLFLSGDSSSFSFVWRSVVIFIYFCLAIRRHFLFVWRSVVIITPHWWKRSGGIMHCVRAVRRFIAITQSGDSSSSLHLAGGSSLASLRHAFVQSGDFSPSVRLAGGSLRSCFLPFLCSCRFLPSPFLVPVPPPFLTFRMLTHSPL